MNGGGGDNPCGFVVVVAAGVEVAVPAREVAAADFDADAVAGAKFVGGGFEVDAGFVDGPGFEPDTAVEPLAVTQAQDALLDVEGAAVRVDIDEFGSDVGVTRIRGDVEHDFEWAGNFQGL